MMLCKLRFSVDTCGYGNFEFIDGYWRSVDEVMFLTDAQGSDIYEGYNRLTDSAEVEYEFDEYNWKHIKRRVGLSNRLRFYSVKLNEKEIDAMIMGNE